ncbi:hypothetical protein K431DRAFT_232872 [Polychaeton citri CBS 116435]|uniref:Zn(2)-C6 fungal-type domain-containing protein n=1 Tax=Polychaeton citri CBS 116435 TaxID=1314669 RepID=A0A9P4ULQ5_9PEZI|nr:hypothetical protein K431DRAFT_232872 [Polychaeton citri CBS 116435]
MGAPETGGGGDDSGGGGDKSGGGGLNQRKRQRQPRNSACQPCASLKMKCVPGPVAGVCERCNRMRRDCVAPVPKPRKKREGQADARDDSALLQTPSSAGTQHLPSTPAQLFPVDKQRTDNHHDASALSSRQDLLDQGSKSFELLLGQGLGLDQEPINSRDLIQGIDYSVVSKSLTVFRQLLVNFPFLEMPISTNPIDLAATRPFLTLAICIVTASNDHHYQSQLSKAFRSALAIRVHVHGDRSIDIVLGLMVFTAWQHQYASGRQTYQELCLLCAMCFDLDPSLRTSPYDAITIGRRLEQDRAILGCYYLCSGISILAFNRPSPLKWSEHLDQSAKSVADNASSHNDQLLLSLTELMSAVESLDEILRALSHLPLRNTTHIDAGIRAIKHRFAALKRQCPSLVTTPGYAAASILLQCRLLRSSRPADSAALIQCAVAIRDYLDDVLHRPSSFFHHVAVVDWANLLQILIAMADMARPNPQGAGWEVGALASMMQPEGMLDSLCNHMLTAPADDALSPRHEGLARDFKSQCSVIKQTLSKGHDSIGLVQGDAPELGRTPNVLDDHYWTNLASR